MISYKIRNYCPRDDTRKNMMTAIAINNELKRYKVQNKRRIKSKSKRNIMQKIKISKGNVPHVTFFCSVNRKYFFVVVVVCKRLSYLDKSRVTV